MSDEGKIVKNQNADEVGCSQKQCFPFIIIITAVGTAFLFMIAIIVHIMIYLLYAESTIREGKDFFANRRPVAFPPGLYVFTEMVGLAIYISYLQISFV